LIIEEYNQFESTEKLSGALRNILDYYGVVAPHTGDPFTEAMLLGIGGGLGLEYLTFTMKSKYFPPEKIGRTSFFLRFWPTSRDFLNMMASRIGATLTVHQTSSRAKGYRILVDALNYVNQLSSVYPSLVERRTKNLSFICPTTPYRIHGLGTTPIVL